MNIKKNDKFDKLKLIARQDKQQNTVIRIKNTSIGDDRFTVIAGPCSIDSEAQIHAIAQAVARQGATILRGGAFKPRTSPYDFQGMGEVGLQYMAEAGEAQNLVTISEVMSIEEIPIASQYVDILQVGSRNMQNFSLLKALGKQDKPVMLKRGLSATYMEFLSAAEYIMAHGNHQVILCERGIRTFETITRNTLDIAAVPVLQAMTHLPIFVDPSHATGLREIIPSMACAAMAVKAEGLMVEVHTDPDASISDARQAICPEVFSEIMTQLKIMAPIFSKKIAQEILSDVSL